KIKEVLNRFPSNSKFDTVVSWIKSFMMFYNWVKSLT
ncbi:MAG TPA: IS6 family transposase, partial [Sulfurihydrogenibium sp.]|nr:IS6 family transposase [Sulfurihydrogenibium sp.]